MKSLRFTPLESSQICVCHNFIGSAFQSTRLLGQRHRILSLTARKAVWVSYLRQVSCDSNFARGCFARSRHASQLRRPELRQPQFSTMVCKQICLIFAWRWTLSLSYWAAYTPALCSEGHTTSIFSGCFLCKHPLKIIWNKENRCLCLHRNSIDSGRMVSLLTSELSQNAFSVQHHVLS